MKLRHYQREAVSAIRREFAGNRSTLLVLPTGAGKTICFGHLVSEYAQHGRCLVLAHRDELISQAVQKIGRITGKVPDVEKADQWADQCYQPWRSPVIVSSVQTQCSGRGGAGRMTRFDPREFSLLVIDEAHHAIASTYRRCIEHYSANPNLRILGVTATPNRHDEEALGQIFGSVAYDYQLLNAIDDGWLVPIEQQVVVVDHLDLSDVRTTAGDLNGRDLARELEREEPLHEIADPLFRLAGDRKTLVFAASVAQAERLAEILNRHESACAAFVCGKTPIEDRRRIFSDFAAKRFRFLVNCAVAGEGFDDPGIEIVAMARPTKSLPVYMQMLGRGTRPLAGVVDGIDDYEPQLHLGDNGHAAEQSALRKAAIAASAKPRMTVYDFVGNAGRHRIVSACDALAGKYSDAVVGRAHKLARESAVPMDVAARLKRAQEMIEKEAEAIARRRHVLGKATFTTRNVDPFDITNVSTMPREPGWHRGRPPTPKQLAAIERAGLDAENLTFWQAHCILDRLAEMPSTPKQQNVLRRAGFDPLMPRRLARGILNTLFANNFRWPDDIPRPNRDGTPAEDAAESREYECA